MNKEESHQPWIDLVTSLMMAVVGALMFFLPFVTWENSKVFAAIFSPALILGPILFYGGAITVWQEMRGILRKSSGSEKNRTATTRE